MSYLLSFPPSFFSYLSVFPSLCPTSFYVFPSVIIFSSFFPFFLYSFVSCLPSFLLVFSLSFCFVLSVFLRCAPSSFDPRVSACFLSLHPSSLPVLMKLHLADLKMKLLISTNHRQPSGLLGLWNTMLSQHTVCDFLAFPCRGNSVRGSVWLWGQDGGWPQLQKGGKVSDPQQHVSVKTFAWQHAEGGWWLCSALICFFGGIVFPPRSKCYIWAKMPHRNTESSWCLR